ncbi:transcriptional regulator [Agrobacterium vitis]|uniref:ArsR/SmtB family transcription factor n=1 Tax=Agrobacterium vitis TaxID=373 RepID=UPI0015DA3921|nr:metalloregulator ArsR/SmtB family transcription factor [Agrobacterium vitis]BCH67030.1 transcriptional regulator [Agrobacterium vitis]
MDQKQALSAFAALSQETRLLIVRMLVVAGPDGMAAGALAEKIDVSPSNISFHLKELEHSGLIAAQRQSRSIIYTANYAALGGLVRFLMEDCCSGHPEICAPVAELAVCCAAGSKPPVARELER